MGLITRMFLFFIGGIIITVCLVSVVRDNNIAVAIISYITGFAVCFILAATTTLEGG